jgi:hypothetical protein
MGTQNMMLVQILGLLQGPQGVMAKLDSLDTRLQRLEQART